MLSGADLRFSNHTGYPSFYFDDYTEKMPSYIAEWKKLNLHFECIAAGFLGSERQIEIVKISSAISRMKLLRF